MAAPAVGAGQKAADRPRRPRRLTGRRAEPRPPRGLDEAEVDRLLTALTAVRDGDFRVRLRVPGDADAPMARLATVVNEVVERNRHLTGELDRVRRVVGRDGRLDERLRRGNAEGAWAGAVTAVNDLVDELVRPTVEIGRVLDAVADGDLSQMIDLRSGDQRLRGEFLRMARTVNGMVDQLRDFADEVTRVAREVGTDGKLGGQAGVRGVSGTWRDLTDSVNTMASRLTNQVRDIALVTTAVAHGDLSRKITVDVAGEMLELKTTVNTMVDQLRAFADEVTRVAREVGTDGVLGGQATVPGVAGTWKDLTDNVNSMAGNLTAQVRDIAQVTTAVARGDLSRKITVDVPGEMLELKTTVNTMVDQLSAFADEVTRVAREVGTEGRLGGQAEVRGVSGTWRDLTDNVNLMAGNLTAQVRNIAQVTTAVARGDLTQEDHRRRARRDPRAEEHRQHDGRPALVVRRRGHPGGPRGRHRGQARRPGRGPRRVRDLAGPHRQRQLDGRQPDRPGAQHRRGDHRGGARRPVPEDHRRCAGRDPRAEPRRSTRWSTSCARSPTRSPGWPARSAPRASSAARPRCTAWPGSGGT